MTKDKVEIYGQPDCTYCTKAAELCEKHKDKLQYIYFTVKEDITLDEFKELFPEARTVPQIRINGTHIGGYRELQAELKY